MPDVKYYNGKLDADAQITKEEWIAAAVTEVVCLSEEEAASLGRSILYQVLKRFRPDLFDNTASTNWIHKPWYRISGAVSCRSSCHGSHPHGTSTISCWHDNTSLCVINVMPAFYSNRDLFDLT